MRLAVDMDPYIFVREKSAANWARKLTGRWQAGGRLMFNVDDGRTTWI
jgi:hypothetical protein